MKKLPYDQVAIVIDKLYSKIFAPGTPEKEIAEYCEFIAQTVESMGWDTDEYMYEYMTRGLPNLNPQLEIDHNAN